MSSWQRLGASIAVGLVVVLAGFARPAAAADAAAARAAIAAADAERWREAVDHAYASDDALLVAYIDWLRLRDDGTEPGFAELAAFLAAHPDWPATNALRARAEAAIGPADSDDAARAFLTAEPPLTRQGRTRLAELLLDDGRSDEAARLAVAIWVGDDFTADDEKAFLGRFGRFLGEADDVARLDRLLWDGEQAQARRMLPRVDQGHRALATARLALRGSGKPEKALQAVPARLRDDPGLLYDRVRRERLRERDDAATALLLEVRGDPVRPDLWWTERQLLARRAMAAGDHAIAYRLVSDHGLRDGTAYVEAEWLAGWLALRFAADPARAQGHFANAAAVVRTPISQARTAYWLGRAAAAMGRNDEARRRYEAAARHPTTFYGQEAARELDLLLQPEAISEAAAVPDSDVAASEPARVAAMLCRIGEAERAAPFLTRLAGQRAGDAAAQAALQAIAADCGRADLLVRVAKAGTLDREPDLRASHPIPAVDGLVRKLPDGPDAATRLAVARQESLFDVDAVSPAGARGLLQLMPATAKAMAAQLGLPYAPGRLTSDPDFNARLGAFYLQRQVDRFDGELAFALAAYNAGPGRVDAWIAQNGDPRGADAHVLIDWIESIPFSETRNYVQRVLENRAVYSVLLRAPGSVRLRAVPEVPAGGELEADATADGGT
ncbi:MAG: lytic transglycosylase domain-containing protein [Geminicoccaceae bacterium]